MAGKSPHRILLGITGSIAAYKSAELCRLLIKAGYEVRCVMTPSAAAFISPLTLSTLSKNDVHSGIATDEGWNNHVEMGMWADLMVIAPLTANTLGKLVNGLADNLLIATYLSARCPVMAAPAMDVDMWHHPSTKRNIQTLQSDGVSIIPVGFGELASGLTGEGRMAEPEEILGYIETFFNIKKDLAGKKIMITAGPTYEHLDPVRFIGNHSSGRMGFALATEARKRGADVTLISGPVHIPLPRNITVEQVTSADEMFEKCEKHFDQQDVVIWAAAVADYKALHIAQEKIKKKEDHMSVELVKTRDIAGYFGEKKKPGQKLIGFALETRDEATNAMKKLNHKKLDFIVLNSLRDEGAGFGHDTNKVSLLYPDGNRKDFPLKSKELVAEDIIDAILSL